MKKEFVFLLAILTLSCRSSTESHEGARFATIIGRVHLAHGWVQTPPFSGIRVSLEGTSFVAMTDDSGQYQFDSVPTGTYTVRFEKSGYGVVRWIGKSVEGGGNSPIFWVDPNGSNTYYTPSLHRIPSTYALLDSAYSKDTTYYGSPGPYVIVEGSFQYGPMEWVTAFIGTDASVSPAPGAARYFVGWDENLFTNLVDTLTGRFTLPISRASFIAHHLNPGDSIYITTRTVDWHGELPTRDYYDPQLGAYVITSVCPTTSRVIGLKVP